MRKEQYLTIILGISLVAALYFAGKTKGVDKKDKTAVVSDASFEDYEKLYFKELPESDAERIQKINASITLQPTAGKYLALSKAWEESGNYPMGAYFYYMAATLNADSASFETAGDKLYNGYKNYGDSLITNNLIKFAVASYEKAMSGKNKDIDLRMKLAETYVESPEPMKGILILRALVDSLPDYTPANMTLGRLSLQTGQYDKAADRFGQVLKNEPLNTEALYFLALANEGLGNFEETIRLLEMCVQLVNNPDFTKEIDAYLNELRKQKLL